MIAVENENIDLIGQRQQLQRLKLLSYGVLVESPHIDFIKRRYAGAERDQTQGRPASGHQANSFQLKNTKITG